MYWFDKARVGVIGTDKPRLEWWGFITVQGVVAAIELRVQGVDRSVMVKGRVSVIGEPLEWMVFCPLGVLECSGGINE